MSSPAWRLAAGLGAGGRTPRHAGFTLVEVMVALAVVAVALPALLTTLYQQADDTAYLRDKSLARMVAANKLQELRLGVAQSEEIRAGKENGSARMAERDWYWWVDINNAPGVEQIFRVDIRVGSSADNADQSLYTLSGFISGDRRVDTSGALQQQGGDDDGSGDNDDIGNNDDSGNGAGDEPPDSNAGGDAAGSADGGLPDGLGQELIDALENAGGG